MEAVDRHRMRLKTSAVAITVTMVKMNLRLVKSGSSGNSPINLTRMMKAVIRKLEEGHREHRTNAPGLMTQRMVVTLGKRPQIALLLARMKVMMKMYISQEPQSKWQQKLRHNSLLHKHHLLSERGQTVKMFSAATNWD